MAPLDHEAPPHDPTTISSDRLGPLLELLEQDTRSPAILVADVLPTLLELTGTAGLLVVRPDGELGTVTAHTGLELPWDDAAQPLTEPRTQAQPPIPASWAALGMTRVEVHPLPGHLGLLVLAGDDAAPSGPLVHLALGILDSALGRCQAQEELDDLAARVDNAQQLALMGDYDWHIPTDTNRWSDQLYRIYGHEPQSFNATYERFLGLIHPDDRERITQIHQQAYATGEPYRMIERIVRPDGEVRHLSSNGQVVMDESGIPVRMRGTCVDITERVLAEEARATSAERFRNLVESSPDAILLADGTAAILQANHRATELLGGEPVGRDLAEILPGSRPQTAEGLATQGLDGRPLTLDTTIVSLLGDDGAGLIAVFLRDASHRLASEALAAHLSEVGLRRQQALEINDNVVQGLTAALYALEMDDSENTENYLRRTLSSARQMIDDLVTPLAGEEYAETDLVRSGPSSVRDERPDPVA